MKRILLVSLIAALALPTVALAGRGESDVRYKEKHRERVERRVATRHRAVVRPNFPLHRSLPTVIVRRHPVPVERHVYYRSAPIIWRAAIIVRPHQHRWGWSDSEVLWRRDGWTDVVLDVNDVGGSLYLELSGSTQLDFAEVVFSDGYARVVDFRQRTHRPGFYELMDFRGRARVDYVRLVARARTPSVRIGVEMAL